ncbi:MAG TPA: tRNA 2-thiocytidine(32) synthetase TtcA [Ruminococcaceae bacterium]|nr:tRNA 2-thiocytidine(32) synthetase TtcA [Oscillospiraceae bacterium]
MQKILGCIRKAVQLYNLIENGDRIAVAISGGKDSLVMLQGLAEFKRFAGIDYSLTAVTIDPCFDGAAGDYSLVRGMCERLDIPYIVEKTDIAKIVFDIRKEKNPCSLCAKMRRGALHELAKSLGCNKLALGHNNDDVVETFIMNLFREGRIACFAPKSYLTRRDLTVIRPLCLASEALVRAAAKHEHMEIVKSKCPADKHTKRQEAKDWLYAREREDKGFIIRLFGAMHRADINGWGFPEDKKH